MKNMKMLYLPLLMLLSAGCLHHRPLAQAGQCLQTVGLNSEQAVLVTPKGSTASTGVTIGLYERKESGWKQVGDPIDGVAGTKGLAPLGEKREGDGRTPSGAFPLERAFGYAPLQTKMPYIVVNGNDVWIDDPKSPRYNMLTSRAEAGGVSYEEMKRKDDLYKYGIVVEYNTKQVIPGAGSAIFFHIWRGPMTSTAGCVATSEKEMITLLQWLDPSRNPVAVIGICPMAGDQ